MTLGYINNIETFGTVDGPGIRYIIFLQGCPLKCKYCHNRDTWEMGNYKKTETAEETFQNILKYKNYIKNGGVTISGGEPLLQAQYCLELFEILKNNDMHTALDTSGAILNEKVKEVLEYTDLVLLDIKSIDNKKYNELTCGNLADTLLFLKYLKLIGKKVWIRHVVIPTITDDDDDLEKLADFLTGYRDIIEKVELLPYHNMGILKWDIMGVEYPLKDVKPLSVERLDNAKKIFRKYDFNI